MAVHPSFYVNLAQSVDYVIQSRYAQALAELEFDRFTKVDKANSERQVVLHREPYAEIFDGGENGGDIRPNDARIVESSFVNRYADTGFELPEKLAEDLDEAGIAGGAAVNLAAEWAGDLAAAEGYWPQRLSIAALRGADPFTGVDRSYPIYDGKELFATDHPVKISDAARGTWANLFTGAPSGSYPGFLPLAGPFAKNGSTGEWEYSAGANVTVEQGRQNLYQALATIGAITLPDGLTPARIRPTTIVHGLALRDHVHLLSQAKFIAMTAGTTGGGAVDIEGMFGKIGIDKPCELAELSIPRDPNGTNPAPLEMYDWYLVDEAGIASSRLGLINYRIRRPFETKFFSPANTYELAVARKMRWVVYGRFGVGPAIPYYGFRFQAPRS